MVEKKYNFENEISRVKAEWLNDFDKLLNSDDVLLILMGYK